MAKKAPAVDYQAIEAERQSEFQKSITNSLSQGKEGGDGIRQVVLGEVASGRYDKAKKEIDSYIAERSSYPNFQVRADPYRKYAIDLVNGIEAKRNLTGVGSLPLSKQQEIFDKVLEHFKELKVNLKQIERHEREAKLDDIRSTTWFLKTFMYALLGVVALGFFVEMSHGGLGNSFLIVFDAVLAEAVDKLLSAVGM